MKTAAGILFLLLIAGCSNLESVNRNRLNHPAMDLTKHRTPPPSPYLTTLGALGNSSGGNSCSACAH